MSVEFNASSDLRLAVGKTIFHHIDGIAIGSTVAALRAHGVFDTLSNSDNPIDVRSLCEDFGCREGFLNVALRLLSHQGFVRVSVDVDSGRRHVCLTKDGIEWLDYLEYYDQITTLSALAQHYHQAFDGQTVKKPPKFVAPTIPADPRPSVIANRVINHIYGEITAVVMTELYQAGIFSRAFQENKLFLSFDDIVPQGVPASYITNIFETNGWAKSHPSGLTLTQAGILASEWAPQYFYPVIYLPTFRSVPNLLFGKDSDSISVGSSIVEKHLDRELDIKFSGMVFEKTCRQPFLDIVLPIFDREPVHSQPLSVVDMGSGDGTLLVELFKAIQKKTIRGRMLESYPLMFVGAEYTEVARRATTEALSKARVANWKVVLGDIGDPTALAMTLNNVGVDPKNALHVSKSVIHNRRYKLPENHDRVRNFEPMSKAVYVATDGSIISPREFECNLVEFFEGWRDLTRKHGMVVIEAHTVDPELVQPKLGQNIVTCMDATHGYSCQYLTEYDTFLRASQAAGYKSLAFRALSGKILGKPTMTINHIMASKK
ncbi:MAG: hypothetical protein AB7V04_10725 [Desulfomonilaceae bacterium]